MAENQAVATVQGGDGNGNADAFINIGTSQTTGATVTIGEAPSSPPILAIEQDFIEALSTTAFALQHAAAADDYIAKLGSLAQALVPPVINPVFPTNANAPAITPPIAPSLQPVVYTPPSIPAAFTQRLSVSQAYPNFDAEPPALIFPSAPSDPLLAVPTSPGIDFNFTYPDVDVVIPPPPELMTVQTVPFGGVTFPRLDATAPQLTLLQPMLVNYIAGAPYSDALLSELTGTLRSRLDIGLTGTNTGLPPSVEQNIWNRGREREYLQQRDALAALDRMETMGYAFPPGGFIDAQIKIQTETHAVMAGQSRDIAVAQAKLEQENIAKAIDATVSIETKLIDYANQREQRSFEACRYATEAGVSIFNAEVQAYTAKVGAYKTAIDAYTAQLEQARVIVQVYQAEIEAEKLKVEANGELVAQYKVQVEAAEATIEIFKAQIQIIQTRAQIENLKVSIFGEQVKAYAAETSVYTTQVEAYKAVLQAEQTKEQVYATQASTYATLVDATFKEQQGQIEIFKAELSAKMEEYDAYKAQIQGQSAQVAAVAQANDSTAKIYSATVSGISAYNDAMVKEWQATIQLAESVTQIGVQAAQANGNLYLTAKSVATDAAKVGAQVEAQIAASALGAVTWATHRSRQDSIGFSTQSSFGQNKSQSQGSTTSSQTSNSNSTSTSAQTSAQTSVSTSHVHNIQSSE